MLFIVFGISKSFEYFQLHLELINYHTSQKYLHKKIQLGTKERWKERRSFAKERERERVRFLASERKRVRHFEERANALLNDLYALNPLDAAHSLDSLQVYIL